MLLLLKLRLFGLVVRVFILFFVACIAGGLIHHGYHWLRGRRDRDTGVPCVQCNRKAFPVEGTTKQYRCWICHCRFEGAEHF
jgi:hypothetical protein